MDADSENRRPLVPRPNGRSSIPLVVNKEGRQSLFHKQSRESLRPDSRPNIARNAHSDGLSSLAATTGPDRLSGAVSPTPSVASSNGDGASRIPRPNSAGSIFSKARRQISLTEAYRMAEAEEERDASAPRTLRISPAPVDGSPSPAPRPRPLSRASNERQTRHAASRDSAAFRRTNATPRYSAAPALENETLRSTDSLSSSDSFDRRFSQFAEEQQQPYQSPSHRLSYSSSNRQASRIPEPGRLAKKTSSSSLSNSPQAQAFSKGHVPKGWVAHLLAREEGGASALDHRRPSLEYAADVPIPSVESDVPPQEPTPPSSRPASADAFEPSPNKSYAWQVDQDFTAGDLQVSDSPRISTVGLGTIHHIPQNDDVKSSGRIRANNKLDEIRQREIDQRVGMFDGTPQEAETRRKNTKLDDIRQLEEELEEASATYPEEAAPQKNQKLDDIREREQIFMSKKALASNRLDDIREQNSMSRSPEAQPKPRSLEGSQDAGPPRPSSGTPEKVPSNQVDGTGEKIPNTPVTIFRAGDRGATGATGEEATASVKSRKEATHSRNGSTHARSDSRDLLRKLARAASSSPAPSNDKYEAGEMNQAVKEAEEKDHTRSHHAPPNPREPLSVEPDNIPRSIGLAGARRAPSSESTKEKRSSRALSDTDPTDRIEGEMKLFALGDNQSERGSVRAPSVGPPSEDEEDDEPTEETPRPPKRDVASMPTPKVIGAYVDTPAMTKIEERLIVDGVDQKEPTTATIVSKAAQVGTAQVSTASDRSRSRPRSKLYVTETHEEDAAPRSSGLEAQAAPAVASSGLRRRRTRSLPRTRGPLINSVKPPTVKDDLLEIQKTYQIEDSTLDDFEQLLVDSKAEMAPSSDIDRLLADLSTKRQMIQTNPDRDNSELERYDRMSKTLTDGLMGIRSAKQGIERLEGNLAHADHPSTLAVAQAKAPSSLKPDGAPAFATASSNLIKGNPVSASEKLPGQSRTYVQVPLPTLYRNKPFRLTFLGSILLALSLWFIAETSMCIQYCRPQSCSPLTGPCIWEPSDPFWGYAIPVKLDQWFTNGEGRRLYEKLSEDVSDKYLDAWDYITGSDIHDVNMATLDFLGKRQHRRRLRKHGLIKPRESTPEQQAKWDALHEARLAIERKREMQEAGYNVDDEMESFAADEAL